MGSANKLHLGEGESQDGLDRLRLASFATEARGASGRIRTCIAAVPIAADHISLDLPAYPR